MVVELNTLQKIAMPKSSLQPMNRLNNSRTTKSKPCKGKNTLKSWYLKDSSLLTLGEEEASSLPITAATGLGLVGWVLSLSGPQLGLTGVELELGPVVVLGGAGAILLWLLSTLWEGPAAAGPAGSDVFGS